MIPRNVIPWFKLPTPLMALPWEERERALKDWEKRFGKYDWRKHWDI